MAAGDGLVTMTPTSIVVAGAGSSASINSDGGVDFTAATSLSLNGVFTSSFDNYLIVMRHVSSSGEQNISIRLRSAGSDESGTNYTRQYLFVTSTSVSAARATSQTQLYVSRTSDEQRSGDHIHVYGPALAQPTAVRNVNVNGDLGAYISDNANTHSLSTSYDGFTIFPDATGITGNIVVFGYEE